VAPLSEGAPGLKDYELLNWFALFATAGTPAPVVAKLNDAVNKALSERKTAELLTVQGIVPRPLAPDAFKVFVAAESQKFAAIIERAKIKLEN
jgi:tripartite-type tricarboxylate transporter receptor subunit TctC